MKNYIIVKKKVFSVLMVCITVCALFLTQPLFGTENYTLLYYGIYLCATIMIMIILILEGNYIKLRRKNSYVYYVVLLPNIAIYILTMIYVVACKQLEMSYAVATNTKALMLCLCAIVLFEYFGEKYVDIIWASCVVNYSIYIVNYIKVRGIVGLLSFSENVPGASLEMHEVTFIFGILFLYYYITNAEKENNIKILVCLVAIVLGYKRILIGAMLVALLFHFFCRNKSQYRYVLIFAMIVFGICMGWLIFVNSPYYESTANMLGIELNYRSFYGDALYARVKDHYKMSWDYVGKGMGYTGVIMKKAYLKLGGTVGLHNDILKYYIDLGCIPSILYFLNMTIFNVTRVLKKFSYANAVNYITIMCCVFVCWTTDNLATYPNFVIVQNIIILSLISNKQNTSVNVELGQA